ncbi:MAG: GNAT family N-acetyltransferase [Ignavibacteriales bacterium]
MRVIKFKEGTKVYLRPFQEKDIELVEFGKNNAEVRETLFLFAPMTQEQVRAEMNAWSGSKEIMLFTICRQDDNEPVGQTAFVRIDYVSRAAVFYLAIYDPQYWSKGYGGEATKLMVDYAFDVLNMNRLHLHVCAENPNAVEAYKKAGFSIEGTLRQAMYHHNKYIDFYVMGMLREEYYK